MTLDIDELLRKAYNAHASDIHLNCNKTPALRVRGEIFKISDSIVTHEDIQNIFNMTVPKEYLKNNSSPLDLDYIYEVKGLCRFRGNYCKDILDGKLTFRTIPYKIKSLKELKLPEYLSQYTKFNNGIVIVTGATGSGKSTTLASLIELVNQTRKGHIITIEDPVEFVYEEKKSIITQRNLEINVMDFKTGIKYALRQDPDFMLVGEIRDKDTLLSAIEASETGHLVFSTLHTNGTIPSLNRLIGFIEEKGQEIFLKRLANCIRAIVHQHLVPTKTGELIPAVEILTFTSTVIDYVVQRKFIELANLMRRSKHASIVTLNQSLYQLYKDDIITKETALENSLEKIELDQMIRGIEKGTQVEEII